MKCVVFHRTVPGHVLFGLDEFRSGVEISQRSAAGLVQRRGPPFGKPLAKTRGWSAARRSEPIHAAESVARLWRETARLAALHCVSKNRPVGEPHLRSALAYSRDDPGRQEHLEQGRNATGRVPKAPGTSCEASTQARTAACGLLRLPAAGFERAFHAASGMLSAQDAS